MLSLVKSWDNRTRPVKMLPSGRSWSRRIQWLDGDNGAIKIKLQDGADYKEVLTTLASANTIWQRFKAGESINDSISILGGEVPASLQSKKGGTQ